MQPRVRLGSQRAVCPSNQVLAVVATKEGTSGFSQHAKPKHRPVFVTVGTMPLLQRGQHHGAIKGSVASLVQRVENKPPRLLVGLLLNAFWQQAKLRLGQWRLSVFQRIKEDEFSPPFRLRKR